MAGPDFRRLHPRLTAVELERTAPFVPELTPVVDARGNDLMTRPWLDWARRLTLVVESLVGGGGGGGGTPDPHAPTHSAGGTDPVTVTNLAGYPGGTTAFLRADHTFAVPPGGVGGGMNLDYLGNYTSGPVYNDGDIVIGSDGVAYMCVVDGTLTPPEPWPGAGIAVNGTVDATYWVVSPHTQLTNERAMNALGTGYVRSTVGEPSVVPTIPLTDTTGVLPDNRLTSNVALKNIDNNFVAQTFAPGSQVRGVSPTLYFLDTAGATDQRYWRFIGTGGNLFLQKMVDNLTAASATITFNTLGGITAQGFAGDGSNITNLNAANLATGTVPIGRLGTNAPSASTFLRGDNTWQAADFPSGMIVLSGGTPCPVGWTRVTALDGYFIRIGPGGSGGSNTHAHAVGSYSIPAHSHPTATADPVGDHSHNFGIHAYFDSQNDSAGLLNVDGGSSGNMSRGPHTHRTQIDFDGGTSNSGNHAHTVPIPAAGAIGLQGGSEYASNVPLYADFWLCQKN